MSVVLSKSFYKKFCVTVTIKDEAIGSCEDLDVTNGDRNTFRFNNSSPRPAQIVHVIDNVDRGWFVTLEKENRRVRGLVSQQLWTTWNPTFKNEEAFVYIFGRPDPQNPGQFLYAAGDDTDQVRLVSGDIPAAVINTADPRLFRHRVSTLAQRDVLEHVASGKLVTVSNKASASLILVENEELASEVIIQFQNQ